MPSHGPGKAGSRFTPSWDLWNPIHLYFGTRLGIPSAYIYQEGLGWGSRERGFLKAIWVWNNFGSFTSCPPKCTYYATSSRHNVSLHGKHLLPIRNAMTYIHLFMLDGICSNSFDYGVPLHSSLLTRVWTSLLLWMDTHWNSSPPRWNFNNTRATCRKESGVKITSSSSSSLRNHVRAVVFFQICVGDDRVKCAGWEIVGIRP